MGGPCDCDGQTHAELDNFHRCSFKVQVAWLALSGEWPSAEAAFQAAKFPDNPAAQEAIRTSQGGMDSFKLGHDAKLRADWEEIKVHVMYEVNKAKFLQNPHLKDVLLRGQGPITARGGLFWKTWNEVLLERIRADFRGGDHFDVAQQRTRLMDGYRAAVRAEDKRAVQAATTYAARRELPPKNSLALTVSGGEKAGIFRVDPIEPQANGHPHFVNEDGVHLYVGCKGERKAWVLEEEFSPAEATGYAVTEVKGSEEYPDGARVWRCYKAGAQGQSDETLHVQQAR